MSLHVAVSGSGENLVLLHGWGMHGGIWDGVKPALDGHFRVHAVDLPGHGGSPACDPYTSEAVAEAIAAVLPESAILCGWSLGGMVALEMARRYPQKIARLVLMATTPCFAQREDWACAMDCGVLENFAAELENDYEGTLKRFLALQARGDETAKAVLRALRDNLFQRGRPAAAALRGGLAILRDADLRSRVAEIRQPALIVHGDRDQLTPLAAGEWLAQTLPTARLTVFHGAAHAPFLSHPEEFTQSLVALHG
ncbi:MAG: pimeloyl-ACP methyl ester esterase BioH [Sulfuricella sp.]|nr:pimeloyl-ACP methyl ester esterase BioH [Sulfuricella sp.]